MCCCARGGRLPSNQYQDAELGKAYAKPAFSWVIGAIILICDSPTAVGTGRSAASGSGRESRFLRCCCTGPTWEGWKRRAEESNAQTRNRSYRTESCPVRASEED